MQKNNEEKERRQIERDEQAKLDLEQKRKIQEEKQREKEVKRQSELKRQLEEQHQRIKEKELKEQKRLNEILEQENRLKEEKRKKQESDKEKIMEHQKQVEMNLKQQEDENKKKQMEQEIREKEWQEKKEQNRKEKLRQNQIRQEQIDKTIASIQMNNEKRLEMSRSVMDQKERKSESQLEEFYRKRELALQHKKEMNAKKQKQILLAIKRSEEFEEEKRIRFIERQNKLEQTVFMAEMNKNKTNRLRTETMIENSKKSSKNRRQLSKDEDERKTK